MKKILAPLFVLFSINLLSINVNGQCLNQVFHTSGTEVVNGINVTVTSEGLVDTFTTYCPQITQPYFIGYDWLTSSSGEGKYNFQFDPPVDSLTLNFSGISNASGGQEIIVLEINGTHYSIPQIGINNNCDPLAMLTTNGNITGCANCEVSGWAETNIVGPISSFSVKDSLVSGAAGGALFSLFICNAGITNTYENDLIDIEFYPNPVQQILNIEGNNLNELNFSINDMFGRQFFTKAEIRSSNAIFDLSTLAKGVYFLCVEKNGQSETHKIIVQ